MSKINSYLLLLFFSLLLFVPGINNLPVVDRDEAHFAQASRQMLQTGQYFQIRFQEKTRFQKPPGINWLQAASVKLLSHIQSSQIWPYRLPSLLGSLFAVLLTFYFASRFVSRNVALLAAGLLASTLLLSVETHMAVIDSSLLMSVVLMQGALWVIYDAGIQGKKAAWYWALIFWLAMAFGLVLKGVTPLVGVLSVGALVLFEKQVAWLRGLRSGRGFFLFLLISLAWLSMLNAAEHSNYLMQMLHKDLLPKLQGGHESHGKPPFFHLAILPLTFWPASLFLWQGARYAIAHHKKPVVRFLLAWIVPTWLFFEIMPTKLPQYVLPTFPAIALLCALAIQHAHQLKQSDKFFRVLQVLWGVLSIGFIMSIAALPFFLMQKLTVTSILLCLTVTVVSMLCVYFAWHKKYNVASAGVLLLALITFPLIFNHLLPQLKPLWISQNVKQLLQTYGENRLSEKNPLLVVGFAEPSLVFYTHTKQVLFLSDVATAAAILQKRTRSLLLIDKDSFDTMAKQAIPLHVLAQVRGYNYSKGRWVVLFLARQKDEE